MNLYILNTGILLVVCKVVKPYKETWFGDWQIHKHWNDDELGRFSFTKNIPKDLHDDEHIYARSFIYGEFDCLGLKCEYGNATFNNHNRSGKSNRVLPVEKVKAGIIKGISYLCDNNNVSNFSTRGVSKNDVCKSIKEYVTVERINYAAMAGSNGTFCPADPGSSCQGGSPGRSIALYTGFKTESADKTASILIHEGQHAHWNENKKPQNQLLENEFISHKLQGLLMQDKNLQTDVWTPNPPNRIQNYHYSKTNQLFERDGNGWRLKRDSNPDSANGQNGIYGAVCYLYYQSTNFTDKDKSDCYYNHGLRRYRDGRYDVDLSEENNNIPKLIN